MKNRGAFSLVELLVAMTILLILMVAMVLLLNDSDRVSSAGNSRARLVSQARSAVQMLADDLQHAVADTNLLFNLESGGYAFETHGYQNNSELSFIALRNDSADTNRAAMEVWYWVEAVSNGYDRYELVRGVHRIGQEESAYDTPAWHTAFGRPTNTGVVASHVTAFTCLVPYASNSVQMTDSPALPAYVDIFIELIDEKTARQVSDMQRRGEVSESIILDKVEANAVRYTTRASFPNRRRDPAP